MFNASILNTAKKSFIGVLWMWVIGSLLSQVVICFMAPHDYKNGWNFYVLMTLAISAIGVFTLGFASLIIVQHRPDTAELMKTWKGIPIGIGVGWLASVILAVITFLITGEFDLMLEKSIELLVAAGFGSIYGLIGACFLLVNKGEKQPERLSEFYTGGK